MGTKLKQPKVVKKTERIEKCRHGIEIVTACEKCEKEKENSFKQIADSLKEFRKTLSKLHQAGWTAFCVDKTNIIRFRHPTKKDSFYCPITAACVLLKNKSFGPANIGEATRWLDLKLGVKEINNAVDNTLLDENTSSLREFIVKEFGLTIPTK